MADTRAVAEGGGNAAVDGSLIYRVDSLGSRVAVLPASCRRGVHNLGKTGYRATEGGGRITIRCEACAARTTVDAAWTLRSSGPVANRAELDDTPYLDLIGRDRTSPGSASQAIPSALT